MISATVKRFVSAFVILVSVSALPATAKTEPVQVPILLYHRFGPRVVDTMTVTTGVFESHLQYLQDHGYRVLPLREVVENHLGRLPSIPSHSVVIAADDAHKSVYTDMVPLLKRFRVPITLFVYPSAISHASYAMTWDQLREVRATGLVDVESHTFWHPNFKTDRKRLPPVAFETFVDMQLKKSKQVLEKELNIRVDMLAWPFGIYDDDLIRKARGAGYAAAFSIERRPAASTDNVMALPRYLMSDGDRGKAFGRIVEVSVRGG